MKVFEHHYQCSQAKEKEFVKLNQTILQPNQYVMVGCFEAPRLVEAVSTAKAAREAQRKQEEEANNEAAAGRATDVRIREGNKAREDAARQEQNARNVLNRPSVIPQPVPAPSKKP